MSLSNPTPFRRLAVLGVLLSLLGSLTACTKPLPVYSARGTEASLAVLAQRSASIQTLSGAGTLTVHNPDQGTVTLEAAVVARRPDQLRVRAWKLGRSMADVVLSGDDVTAKLDRRVGEESLTEGLRGMRQVLLSVDEAFFDGASERPGTDEAVLVVRGQTREGVAMTCEIDRATLTTRRVVLDAEPGTYFTLERYREIDGTVWPMRIRAFRGEREATIRFDWIEFNTEIAPGALPDQAPSPPKGSAPTPPAGEP